MGDFIQYIAKEWHVIWQAPVTFIAATIVVCALVWGAMEWRYSGIIDNQNSRITTLTDENARIRVAVGLDQATPNALLTLSNTRISGSRKMPICQAANQKNRQK